MAKGESGFTKAGKGQNNGYAPGDSPYQAMSREAGQVIRDSGYDPMMPISMQIPWDEEFSALSDRHYTAIYNSISDGQSPTSRFSKATGEEILKRVERNKVYVADRARHKGISDAKGNIDEAATVRNYRDEMKKLSAIEEYVKKKLKRK